MVPFRKSTRSSTNGGPCVEVGAQLGVVAVRDANAPTVAGRVVYTDMGALPVGVYASDLSANGPFEGGYTVRVVLTVRHCPVTLSS